MSVPTQKDIVADSEKMAQATSPVVSCVGKLLQDALKLDRYGYFQIGMNLKPENTIQAHLATVTADGLTVWLTLASDHKYYVKCQLSPQIGQAIYAHLAQYSGTDSAVLNPEVLVLVINPTEAELTAKPAAHLWEKYQGEKTGASYYHLFNPQDSTLYSQEVDKVLAALKSDYVAVGPYDSNFYPRPQLGDSVPKY